VVGVVLAAGAGSRLGLDVPKALVQDFTGLTWLERSVTALREGGADPIFVVVGADASAVKEVVPPRCYTVDAPDWQEGMGASLRAALTLIQLQLSYPVAVTVMLVDTPGVGAEVVRRVRGYSSRGGIVRASYGGVPGHPVSIGHSHISGVLAAASGDRGARDYLSRVDVELVECGDIGSGEDIDTPEQLASWLGSSTWGMASDQRS
jgi:CTP:molybdopterin cytidylyltransferase MocA